MTDYHSNNGDYSSLSKEAKGLVQWQALRLKNKGFKYSQISKILNVHARTISKWWNDHSSTKKEFKLQDLIKDKFKKLTPEMKVLIIHQATALKDKKKKYSDIASILGLTNGAQVSRWIRSYKATAPIKQKKSEPRKNTSKRTKVVNNDTHKNKNKKESDPKKINAVRNATHEKGKDQKEPNNEKKLMKINDLKKKIQFLQKLKEVSNLKKEIKLSSKLKRVEHLKKKINHLDNLKKAIHLKEENKRSIKIERLEKKIAHLEQLNVNLNSKLKNERENSPLYQLQPEQQVHLNSNVKVIKGDDYAHYYKAETFLRASQQALTHSKQKVINIEQQAEKDAQIAITEAQQNAYDDGLRRAEEQLAMQNIEAMFAAEEYLTSLKSTLPELIINIIRKFIENYDDKEFVIHQINSSLKVLSKEQKVKLHLNDEAIKHVKKQLKNISYPKNKISLVSDKSLQPTDCLVVTKLGIVNTTLETQLKKLEVGLKA